jgi:uracil phosphoribosyltransferase
MNAIELANELDKLWDKSFRNPIISQSADMLRQQAKTIEQFRFVLRNLALATSKEIGDLEEQPTQASEK